MNILTQIAAFTVAVATACSVAAHATPQYTTVTFTGTDNMQSTLIVGAQTGSFTPTNGFGAPFAIPAVDNNYFETYSPLTITGLSIFNPTDIYTLMNAYGPVAGSTIGAYKFKFSDGSSTQISIVAGLNVRDFYQNPAPLFSNTFTASYVRNAFTYTNTRGGGGTGNTSTGPIGTYVIDEQDFNISSFASGKTLIEIDLTSPNSGVSGGGTGLPILLGLTVQSTSVPEPTSLLVLATSGAALLTVRRRVRQSAPRYCANAPE
jgi:hypothetical protein